jgi:hypothetical protein
MADADYVRQLEKALMVLWEGCCDDDVLQMQADSPDVIKFVMKVRSELWSEQADDGAPDA